MKKAILYLFLMAGLVSCVEEVTPAVEEIPAGVPMSFNLTVTDGPETKAAKTAWEENDVIYVFFKGLGEKYLKLIYNGSSWDNASGGGTLLDTDFADLEYNTLTAVHFPVPVNVVYEEDYLFGFYDSSGWNLRTYYLFEFDKDYTVDGSIVTASLSLGKPNDVVLFHIAGLTDNIGDYGLSCPLVMPFACIGVTTDGSLVEEEFDADSYIFGFADADGAVYSGRLLSSSPEDYTFTLHGPANTYTLSRSDRALAAGKMYNFPALDSGEWTNFVDLGLPSGRLWATMNLGASGPDDDGNYFAWGETAPKTRYNWETYKWMQEGQSSWGYITKYTFEDNNKDIYTECIWFNEDGEFIGDGKKSLQDYDNADDAAYAALGGNSRIPTEADWIELRDECTWAWKKPTYAGGTYANYGYLVTGPNNNSIFLPAAGRVEGSSVKEAGGGGYYWLPSLGQNYSQEARYFYFFSGETKYIRELNRYNGFSVRPVSD